MSGYLYKYTNPEGDVVYVGQSKNQISLINRLHSHHKNDWGWEHECRCEYFEVPYDFDLTEAETAAINYYYKKGISQNVHQVGNMTFDESKRFLTKMGVVWVPVDYNDLLPKYEAPHVGGIVLDIRKNIIYGAYIITQIIHTGRGTVYKLYRTDLAARAREKVTYSDLIGLSSLHFYNKELFEELTETYKWDWVEGDDIDA